MLRNKCHKIKNKSIITNISKLHDSELNRFNASNSFFYVTIKKFTELTAKIK